jgi:hypothetical protein
VVVASGNVVTFGPTVDHISAPRIGKNLEKNREGKKKNVDF